MIGGMPTNAQAALAAAATVYAGRRPSAAAVKLLAETFKNWLDHQDAAEPDQPEQRDTALDALVERAEPAPDPELHRDNRGEPLYQAGQTIGFSGLLR